MHIHTSGHFRQVLIGDNGFCLFFAHIPILFRSLYSPINLIENIKAGRVNHSVPYKIISYIMRILFID